MGMWYFFRHIVEYEHGEFDEIGGYLSRAWDFDKQLHIQW